MKSAKKTNAADKPQHVREAYRAYVEEFFQCPLKDIPNPQKSEGLARFYIERIYNLLHSPISSEDLDEGLVDASNDLGTDFVYRDDQSVLVLQSKYLGDGRSVDLDDILHFQSVFDRLQRREFQKNQRLAERWAEVEIEHDNFVMLFVTLGAIEGQAKVQTTIAPHFPVDGLGERTEYQYLGPDELKAELKDAGSLSGAIPGDFELIAVGKRGGRSPVILIEDEEYPSCVLVVEARQLVDLYTRFRNKLFTLNIRNYLGKTATNKLLRQTLESEPAHFYYFNNGISCIAEHLEVEADRVRTRGLQVINGAQTIRSLVKATAWTNKKDELLEARVLVRVTQAAAQYAAEGKFRKDIVRYNNTQNVIKESDFRSNDPIHFDLRSKFGEHRRFAKEVKYLSKRTDPSSHRGAETVPLEEFAKVIYSFLKSPTQFSSKTSFLFDDTDDGGYRTVFGDGKETWTAMPEDEFRLRASIWWLSVVFGEQLKADKKRTENAVTKAALERKWMLLFTARLVLERSYGGDEYKADLRTTYKGDWRLDSGGVGEWMRQLYDVSKQTLIYLYTEAHKKRGFVHRNWMRDPDTLTSLEDYVATAPIQMAKRRH